MRPTLNLNFSFNVALQTAGAFATFRAHGKINCDSPVKARTPLVWLAYVVHLRLFMCSCRLLACDSNFNHPYECA